MEEMIKVKLKKKEIEFLLKYLEIKKNNILKNFKTEIINWNHK